LATEEISIRRNVRKFQQADHPTDGSCSKDIPFRPHLNVGKAKKPMSVATPQDLNPEA
jgi:hypothetical protein